MVRALDLKSGGLGSSPPLRPLAGVVLGSPKCNSMAALVKTGLPPATMTQCPLMRGVP